MKKKIHAKAQESTLSLSHRSADPLGPPLAHTEPPGDSSLTTPGCIHVRKQYDEGSAYHSCSIKNLSFYLFFLNLSVNE